MYKLSYELSQEGNPEWRKAVALLLPPSVTLAHALVEAATVMADVTYRLHKLTLEQLYANGGLRMTLLRYERDGL